MQEAGFAKSSEAERQSLPPERAWGIGPWLLALLGLAVVVGLWALVKPSPELRGERHPSVGLKLATFHLEPLTGEARPASSADLAGKITLVNFWGPWCGPCGVEFPHLVEIEQHFRTQPGFQFFSVSSNSDPRDEQGLAESTERFMKQQQADFPTYRDPQAQTTIGLVNTAKIEQFGYPATVLLGRDGAIRGLWIGYMPGDERAVRRAIETALVK
jgi:cytochrome c biogenesis protein CcmG/thiol:disulfide interchange protein DsbE